VPQVFGGQVQIDLRAGDLAVAQEIANGHQPHAGMRFSPDGRRLAILVLKMDEQQAGHMLGEEVQVFEFPGGKQLSTIPAELGYGLPVVFSPDGTKLLSRGSSRVRLWDATSGQMVRELEVTPQRQVISMAFSPDGGRIAASGLVLPAGNEEPTGTLWIWDVATGNLERKVEAAEAGKGVMLHGQLRFSPSGEFLAVHTTRKIDIVETATGRGVGKIEQLAVHTMQWAQDGRTITTISMPAVSDGGGALPEGRYEVYPRVRVWDWRTRKETEVQ